MGVLGAWWPGFQPDGVPGAFPAPKRGSEPRHAWDSNPVTEQHWLPVIWSLDEGNQENTTPRAQDKKECWLVVAIETRLRFGRAPLIASAQRLFARDSNLVQDGGGILSS